MMGLTHAVGAADVVLIPSALWLHPAPKTAIAAAGLAMAAGLAVDLDHRRSEVTRKLGAFGWLGYWLTRPRCGGFRGPLHSEIGLAVVLCAAWLPVPAGWWPGWVALAVTAGWCSHLFLDAWTKEGLRWRGPLSGRYGWLLRRHSLTTGVRKRKRGRRGRRRFGRWVAEEGERVMVRPVLVVAAGAAAWIVMGVHA